MKNSEIEDMLEKHLPGMVIIDRPPYHYASTDGYPDEIYVDGRGEIVPHYLQQFTTRTDALRYLLEMALEMAEREES